VTPDFHLGDAILLPTTIDSGRVLWLGQPGVLSPAAIAASHMRSIAALLILSLPAPWVLAQGEVNAFSRQVAPVLAKYCIQCHGGKKAKGGIAFDGFQSEPSVSKDRLLWEKVRSSLRAQEMPPGDKPKPTRQEVDQIVGWIETSLAKSDCSLKVPGRVTVRRLNRVEYNNTIRDLIGVYAHLADDFPADDVGYGFDNIGDVLSMPPILFEKYLAAADKIVTQLFDSADPKKVALFQAPGRGLRSTIEGEHFRGQGLVLITNGAAYADINIPNDGDYLILTRAYGDQAGDEPARMALQLDGRDLKTIDVKATHAQPQNYDLKVSLKAGKHRVALAFLNDYYNPKAANPKDRDRNLIIEGLELRGPLNVPRPPPVAYQRIMICRPDGKMSHEDCARKIFESFVSRAYRRPAVKDEVERLVKFITLAESQGDGFDKGIQLALQAVLTSPHFLFRIEKDRLPDRNGIVTLSDFELATRLSYFLWSSMPDEPLFALAREGKLKKDGNLEAQVRRMLGDPKSKALVENFAGQWLQTRNLKTMTPDSGRFPTFNEPLRAAMLRETELFCDAIMREDRSIVDFLDADFTYLNERLAKHYGIANVVGEDFRRVSLSDRRRGGVLTQASILTVTSNPTRTSPVKRGKWVLENILGTPPPPPPPDVPELKDDKKTELTGTLKQRMEQHRAKAICASCHQRMDALGFCLENFDAVGAWRTQDGKFPIDAGGTLPDGKNINGPGDLKTVLKVQMGQFRRCLAEKLLTYALGRGLESFDACSVDEIVATTSKNGDRFSALVVAIVASEAFQKKQTKRGGR
jgi:hypothetical protein